MLARPATADDLDAVRAIARAYGNLGAWPRRPDYLDLELAERGLWVAEDEDGVAGFAGVLQRGVLTHLGDLFVDPARLGRGIGSALLAALPREDPRTTFASSDERALPLYVRWGLVPLAPLVYLAGERAPAGGAPVDRCAVGDVVELDAAASGGARPRAFELLAEAGAIGLRAGDGYAVLRGGQIGPAAGGAAEVLGFAAAAIEECSRVEIAVPGLHPALAPLLAAGWRTWAVDQVMASEAGLLDLGRYLPGPDLG